MAKDLQRAIDASVKASEAHSHLDQKMYMSAKHLESAAFFAKDLKRPDEAARLTAEKAYHELYEIMTTVGPYALRLNDGDLL